MGSAQAGFYENAACSGIKVYFLIGVHWAVSRYLCAMCYICMLSMDGQRTDDLYENSSVFKKEFDLDIAFIHRIDEVLWNFDFAMGFIFLVGRCSLLCVESISVCMKVSPGLSKEFPDCNEFTCIKTLRYEDFGSRKPSIRQISVS